MTEPKPITTLFLDIGGVLLTNGWDHHARRRAVERFALDPEAFEERHHLAFDALETGTLSLDAYLDRVVFHEHRPFTPMEFREFMFAQSKPHPEMLDLFGRMKEANRLKVIAVSNEGRELTEYRVRRFELGALIDCFISSCFVHIRKPDLAIFRMALDISQVPPEQVAYVDDRAEHVQAARTLDIHAVHHEDVSSTGQRLAALGLGVDS
jgi:putative hydrolase of the HAD superfamily